ncbi:MAG: TorD/DmsD family molecular chaperone [Candidatus Loosdrechtia sp.]|uniref:TorD/DmsD family molecular chaperone n=1 Tax=Candidatus Loosdrechtia sp. TaxID=3101272 RepID=UPI003A6A4A61|nr:MAG: molecular chaperone TorD family protein [Candidatus Jettenia sp. AMX2]
MVVNKVSDPSLSGELELENLLTRSTMYQLLSTCFLHPEEKNLSVFNSADFDDYQKKLGMCYEKEGVAVELQNCLGELVLQYKGTALDVLKSDYLRIVGHTIAKECPLYETQYGAAHVYQQTHELADIQGFYKAFGLEMSDVERERCDHISVELEFMHYLLYKQAYAAENHGEEKVQVCVDAQKKFLKEHVGKWVPLFTVLFAKKAGEGFFYALAALTKEFIRLEMKLMDVTTEMYKESDMNQEAVAGAPDECLSCASSEDVNGG